MVASCTVTFGAVRFAEVGRKSGRNFAEEAPLERGGLVAEHGPGQVQIPLRRGHARVAGLRHDRDRRGAGGGVVRDRGVPQVVERPNVVGDASTGEGRVQRLPELVRRERPPSLRMVEDPLVIALERGAAAVLPQGLGEAGGAGRVGRGLAAAAARVGGVRPRVEGLPWSSPTGSAEEGPGSSARGVDSAFRLAATG